MAEGVRLHHPTLRSCAYILWEPEYKNPGSQGGVRKAKRRVLLIDEHGDTIVSTTVWHRLQAGGAVGRLEAEFLFMNAVPDPPTLRVGGAQPTMPQVERQINDAIREIAPAVTSFTIKPSGKYRPPVRTSHG